MGDKCRNRDIRIFLGGSEASVNPSTKCHTIFFEGFDKGMIGLRFDVVALFATSAGRHDDR